MADNDSTEAVAVAIAVEPTPEAPATPKTAEGKAPTCRTCKGALTVYEGSNPLKIGTGFCDRCGVRQPLKG